MRGALLKLRRSPRSLRNFAWQESVIAGIAVAVILVGSGAFAWAAPDEPVFRRVVLMENEDVQVVEIRYEPGSVSPLHTHEFPRRAIYVESGGTLEITPGRKLDDGTLKLVPGGEATRIEITAGQALWLPAQTHTLRNVGKTFIRAIEVEIKNATP